MKGCVNGNHVERAVAYAQHTLRWLDDTPDCWDDRVANHAGVCLLEKIHSEVSLLGLVVSRQNSTGQASVEALLDEMADRLSAAHHLQRALGRVLRLPQLSPAFALPVRFRESRGRAQALDSRLIRRALAHPLVEAIERFPFRRLDVAWVKQQFALPNQLEDRALLASTCLVAPVHPIYASLTDLYGLTHAIFYHSDFGAHPLDAQIVDLEALAQGLSSGAAYALSEGNLDLLAELVCCAWCLPVVPAWAPAAAELLLGMWDRIGYVPGPEFEVSLLASSASPAVRRTYVVRSTYHPTLVAGIMAAVAQQQGAKPVADTPVAAADSASKALEDLQRLGCANSAMSHQILQAAAAPNNPRTDRLAALLADAALIQACRRYDLDVLLELLEAGATRGSTAPCTAAAVEFLSLQEVGEGYYGAHFLDPNNLADPRATTARDALLPRIRSVQQLS